MKSLTSSDRRSLIRLASSLPKGNEQRRAILAGLTSANKVAKDWIEKAAGRGISPFQARAVYMQFDYPEEYWHPKELPDDKDIDTEEAEDILRSEGLEAFQRGMGYDEVDEDGEEIDEDDIDVDEVYGDLINERSLERVYKELGIRPRR